MKRILFPALAVPSIALIYAACGGALDSGMRAFVPSSSSASSWSGDGGTAPDGGSSFAATLPIPAVLQPSSTDSTTDYYKITVKAAPQQVLAGNATTIWGFNGVWPGPTIVATKGRQISVTQTNALSENITIHNHGHSVPAQYDGHPTDYIVPGASKTYLYPNNQRAATLWYHDHTYDLTGKHVYYGMAGFYIIRDPAEDALNLPSGSYDVPLVLQDRNFNADNSLNYTVDSSALRSGLLGNTLCVNGAVTPHLDVATHKYRFRILNGSNARSYRLGLSNGASFQVVASDQGLLAAPVTVTSLSVAPAERFDVVIDFSKSAVGSSVVLQNTDGDSPSLPNVMSFNVTSAVSDTSAVPATLSTINKLSTSQVAVTRNLTFEQSNSGWTINGLTYDPNRIDYTPALGTVERWVLQNRSGEMHPFHQHLSPHQVLSVGRGSPPPELQGWKDTIAVPAWSSAEILIQWTGYKGTYVFHCHKLEHEDNAMMLQLQTQ
jgi:spore coat protein A, manganese oxidase